MAEEARQAEVNRRLVRTAQESLLDVFGWLPPGDPRDIYGEVDGFYPVPPGGVPPYYWNSKKRGEVLPVYTTWLQLKGIRDRSRRLCAENEFAICAVENRRNYVIGDGFTYRATGDEELATMVQSILDAWASTIEIASYEAEAMERLDRDGEYFLRCFPRESGLLELRFVEPEHVKDMAGDIYSPAYSFGIVSDPNDIETVLGYNIIMRPWENDITEFVPAEEIIHDTLNVPRTAKRGLPTFYAVENNLRRAEDLLASMGSMAKARAKIALIRKLLNTTQSAAQTLTDSLKVAQYDDPMTSTPVNIERMRYGTILTSSGNVDYEFPGGNLAAGSFVEILQAELRAVAARLQMPEWMLTVDASNANFSSSLIAGTPSDKSFRFLQRKLCRRFGESRHPFRKSAAWRQIEYAIKLGVLPPEVVYKVKIQCEPPSLEVRDRASEAQVNQMYLDMGIKSPQTIAQEQGLDYEQEKLNRLQAGLDGAGAPPIAVQQQESVKHATEKQDNSGKDHDTLGQYTDPRFNVPGAEYNDPKTKQAATRYKAAALKADAEDAVADASASNEPGDTEDAAKAVAAAANADLEHKQVESGEIRPDKQELDSLLNTGPVGFISAGKNPNNDDDDGLTDEDIAERQAKLAEDLTSAGFKFVRIKGRYGNDEDSFIVRLPQDAKSALVALGKKYGQDSVIYSEKGDNELIYTTGNNAGKANRGKGFEYLPDAEDYYSEYQPEGSDEPLKFSLNFDFNQLHDVRESEQPRQLDLFEDYAPNVFEHITKSIKDWNENRHKSQAFRDWFGDWENDPENASKVVNADKQPGDPDYIKTVLHGTPDKDFRAFRENPSSTMVGAGHYFSEDPKIATNYSDKWRSGKSGRIIKAHLNIRNPLDFDKPYTLEAAKSLGEKLPKRDQKLFNAELERAATNHGGELEGYDIWTAAYAASGEVNANVAKLGFDGITHRSADKAGSYFNTSHAPSRKEQKSREAPYGRVWIAFHPNQIKSIENRGTFDEGHDIYEADEPLPIAVRKLLRAKLPPSEGFDDLPPAEKVTEYFKALDKLVKRKTGMGLKKALQDGPDPLRGLLTENINAAIFNGEHIGGSSSETRPDTLKVNNGGVRLFIDSKATKNTRARRRVNPGNVIKQAINTKAAAAGLTPVFLGLNPGGNEVGGHGSMVLHRGPIEAFAVHPKAKLRANQHMPWSGDIDDLLSNPKTLGRVRDEMVNAANAVTPAERDSFLGKFAVKPKDTPAEPDIESPEPNPKTAEPDDLMERVKSAKPEIIAELRRYLAELGDD